MIFDKSQINLDFKWFLSNCHIYKYPTKSTLIHQGEKAETLLYIINGIVSFCIKDNEGKEVIIYNLGKKNFIGENELFKKVKIRKYWIRAKTACEIAEIPYTSFYRLITVNVNILIYLTSQVIERMENINLEKISNLTFFSNIGKIAQMLLHLSKKQHAINHNTYGVKIKFSNKEISKMVGCSEEITKKVLNIFKSQNLIDFNDKEIVVYNNF